MSVVTEHLEQRGSLFEVIPHQQAYTSVDEARALGVEVGEVLKTLAVRTGSGYALMVIPASRRLDLHLAREALGDSRARLAGGGGSESLAVRTGSGYGLMVIPASRRLDLHLAREALGDSRARLASEEELGRAFPDYELGALPPLGALLDAQVHVDPEVLGHDSVTFQ